MVGGDTLTILIGRQSWDLDVSDLQLEVYRARTPRQGAVRGMKEGAVGGGRQLLFATAAPSGQQELREPSERSPRLAAVMEFLTPFAGHVYAGDIKRGLLPNAVRVTGVTLFFASIDCLDCGSSSYSTAQSIGVWAGFLGSGVGTWWGAIWAGNTARDHNRALRESQGRVDADFAVRSNLRHQIEFAVDVRLR